MGYFSIGSAFSSAWGTFKEAPIFFIGFQFLISVTSIAFQALEGLLTGSTIVLGIPLAILEGGIVQFINMKFLQRGFNIHYEKHDRPGVDPDGTTWLKLFGANLLRNLLILVGTLLFIIPGIYFAVKYVLFQFVIIDRETGVIESLSEAGELAKGNWWKLFLMSIITIIFTLSGLLLLIVGVFFTASISSLVWMHVYLQLKDGDLDDETESIIDHWLEEQEKKREQPIVAAIVEEEEDEEYKIPDDEESIKRAASLDYLEL